MANATDMPARWMSVDDIATTYGVSPSLVRTRLREFLEKNPSNGRFVKGEGSRGGAYRVDLVAEIFQSDPPSLDGASRVFTRGKDAGRAILRGVLPSRREAPGEYAALVAHLIESGESVRIRAIAGTDFCTAQGTIGSALTRRPKRQSIRLLLLNPFCDAAGIRAEAEGDLGNMSSQLFRDALGSFWFLYQRARELNLDPRWVDAAFYNLLVWGEEYALIENYDLSKPEEIQSPATVCIGRHAPVFVIRGGIPYHRSLKEGFDYLFEKQSKNISRLTIKQLEKRYSERGMGFPRK